jgi:hypothetical protein
MPLKTLGPIGPRAVGERVKQRDINSYTVHQVNKYCTGNKFTDTVNILLSREGGKSTYATRSNKYDFNPVFMEYLVIS